MPPENQNLENPTPRAEFSQIVEKQDVAIKVREATPDQNANFDE